MSADERQIQFDDSSDVLARFLAVDGSFRVVACLNTQLVIEAVRRHDLTGLAAIALGRALTAGQLLATLTKEHERVTLQINSDGQLGGLMVDAWSNGDARGYVQSPLIRMPDGQGRPRVSTVLGRKGTLTVFRDLGLKEMYQGTGTLTMGEIDEDVEAYLRLSEQIPSALGCEVILDEYGCVVASAGILIQSMPGTREQEGDPVREAQHLFRTGTLRRALEHDERDPGLLAAMLVPDYPVRHLSTIPVRFYCPCDQDRVTRALITLGPAELKQMLDEQHGAEVTCHFCNKLYRLDEGELARLLEGVMAKLN